MALVREPLLQVRLVGEVQRHQLVVARQQVGDGTRGDGDLLLPQCLVNLGDTAMVAVAQGANAGNDVEAELMMGQGPGAFFLGAIGLMVPATLGIVAADDGQGEAADVVQGGNGALILINHPETAPTARTLAAHRGQVHGAGDRRTFRAAGHTSTPNGACYPVQMPYSMRLMVLQQGLPF